MKYLFRFSENISIYDNKWQQFLPNEIVVLNGGVEGVQRIIYKRGNIMLNSDMVQITYYQEDWGAPDTFEIDIYLVQDDFTKSTEDSTTVINRGVLSYQTGINKMNPNLRLDVDITFGDLMACEFSIDRQRGVKVFQETSHHSKFDRSNTLFAIEDHSLQKLVRFFNMFNLNTPKRPKTGDKTGNLTIEDFYFVRNLE